MQILPKILAFISAYYYLINKIIASNIQFKQASIFVDDSGFKIYKTTIKTYISNKIYKVIKKPVKYMLKTWKILDNIKIYFFELNKLTFSFIFAKKDKYLILKVQNVKKMIKKI